MWVLENGNLTSFYDILLGLLITSPINSINNSHLYCNNPNFIYKVDEIFDKMNHSMSIKLNSLEYIFIGVLSN